MPIVRRLVLLTALVAACAPKPPALPPVPGLPRYPSFMFPMVPQPLGESTAVGPHMLGWDALQAGDLRLAERQFGAALKNAPDFYPAEAAIGYVALARRETRAAAIWFARALNRAPGYVPALVGRGEALLAAGRDADALESFEAALAADAATSPPPGPSEWRDTVRGRVDALKLRVIEQHIAGARRDAEAGRLDSARDRYALAIAASPDSAFLYRELALVELRDGHRDEAFAAARRAVELDRDDVRALVTLGEVHEARAEFEMAVKVYEKAAALDNDPELTGRVERARERAALAKLPAAYHAIASAESVTRGDVAALIGVRLADLVTRAGRRSAVVITDARRHWASTWILAVARSGIMEVYPNHTFQPAAVVRRGDFAEALARAIEMIAARDPKDARGWKEARPRFVDLAPGHPAYPAAALAVAAGALPSLEGDTMQLSRPVTGAEAAAAIERLLALWKRRS